MTPHTEHRPHIRDLIRSFARVDEHFDGELPYLQHAPEELQALNACFDFILSLPLTENLFTKEQGQTLLRVAELRRIHESIPLKPENAGNLREALRDKLYDFLLRMDHCTNEQLCTRGIAVPGLTKLSLLQVQQLVVFMISDTLRKMETSEELSAE